MVLDTRLVFDWRFRDEQWKRRARLVAREFRSGDASNEETFSPTSSKWIIQMFLVLALVQQLCVLVMDVKDAFLTVPQRDLVIVEIPTWAKSNDMTTNGVDFWKLVRCLPGQRKAALHWHEHFEPTVSKFDFIPFEGMVTVYKHRVKCMYITIHVDDLLIIGAQDECEWFKAEISQCFTVKSEGPYSLDKRWECQYLKRTLICNETGIVVEPSRKYIPKLLELLKMENRRGKSLPHHAQLEAYSADRVLEAEKLGTGESKVFRGGLGICLYLAQDRPDIQESVKTLAGYMGCPTVKAMSALKHLAAYLKNTMEYGVMLYKCGPGDVLMDHLSQFCQVDTESLNRSRSDFELEVYSDSNWAGCNVTRKSTTSFMVFLCGNLILSACRTQASIALSSCEAELLAGTAAVGDAIQMSNILRFLVGEEKLENSATARVTLTLHTDASSAKAAWQRRGSGRLKHIDIRMLWLQRMLRKQYIRVQKVPTTYNPSDLNTKKLPRARRELLMSIIGVTDDREVLKFMPPIPKINGSVMRALVALAGLPMAGSQATGIDGDDVLSDYDWFVWCSAFILLVMTLSVVLNMARSGSERDNEQSSEDRTALMQYEGEPVGHRNELLRYIAMTGEFFAVIMEGTQFERDVVRRFPGTPLPEDTIQVSLHQLELCTRSLMNRHLESAKAVLDLCASVEQNIPSLIRSVDRLKEMFPDCLQQDAVTHGRFLYEIHGNYIQQRGYNVRKIRADLGLPVDEPEAEDDIAVGEPMADENGDEDGSDSHTSSTDRFTVENDADRRVRYLSSTMSECSSPGFWQRLHHFDESFSEAEDEQEGEQEEV